VKRAALYGRPRAALRLATPLLPEVPPKQTEFAWDEIRNHADLCSCSIILVDTWIIARVPWTTQTFAECSAAANMLKNTAVHIICLEVQTLTKKLFSFKLIFVALFTV